METSQSVVDNDSSLAQSEETPEQRRARRQERRARRAAAAEAATSNHVQYESQHTITAAQSEETSSSQPKEVGKALDVGAFIGDESASINDGMSPSSSKTPHKRSKHHRRHGGDTETTPPTVAVDPPPLAPPQPQAAAPELRVPTDTTGATTEMAPTEEVPTTTSKKHKRKHRHDGTTAAVESVSEQSASESQLDPNGESSIDPVAAEPPPPAQDASHRSRRRSPQSRALDDTVTPPTNDGVLAGGDGGRRSATGGASPAPAPFATTTGSESFPAPLMRVETSAAPSVNRGAQPPPPKPPSPTPPAPAVAPPNADFGNFVVDNCEYTPEAQPSRPATRGTDSDRPGTGELGGRRKSVRFADHEAAMAALQSSSFPPSLNASPRLLAAPAAAAPALPPSVEAAPHQATNVSAEAASTSPMVPQLEPPPPNGIEFVATGAFSDGRAFEGVAEPALSLPSDMERLGLSVNSDDKGPKPLTVTFRSTLDNVAANTVSPPPAAAVGWSGLTSMSHVSIGGLTDSRRTDGGHLVSHFGQDFEVSCMSVNESMIKFTKLRDTVGAAVMQANTKRRAPPMHSTRNRVEAIEQPGLVGMSLAQSQSRRKTVGAEDFMSAGLDLSARDFSAWDDMGATATKEQLQTLRQRGDALAKSITATQQQQQRKGVGFLSSNTGRSRSVSPSASVSLSRRQVTNEMEFTLSQQPEMDFTLSTDPATGKKRGATTKPPLRPKDNNLLGASMSRRSNGPSPNNNNNRSNRRAGSVSPLAERRTPREMVQEAATRFGVHNAHFLPQTAVAAFNRNLPHDAESPEPPGRWGRISAPAQLVRPIGTPQGEMESGLYASQLQHQSTPDPHATALPELKDGDVELPANLQQRRNSNPTSAAAAATIIANSRLGSASQSPLATVLPPRAPISREAVRRREAMASEALQEGYGCVHRGKPDEAKQHLAVGVVIEMELNPFSTVVQDALMTLGQCHLHVLQDGGDDALYFFSLAIELAQRASESRVRAAHLAALAAMALYEGRADEAAIIMGQKALRAAREIATEAHYAMVRARIAQAKAESRHRTQLGGTEMQDSDFTVPKFDAIIVKEILQSHRASMKKANASPSIPRSSKPASPVAGAPAAAQGTPATPSDALQDVNVGGELLHSVGLGDVEVTPFDPRSSSVEVAVILRRLGLAHEAAGDLKTGRRLISEAIEIILRFAPRSLHAARAYRDRGRIHLELDHIAEAKADLQQAVLLAEHDKGSKNHPRDVTLAYEGLGDCLVAAGDMRRARDEYEKALQLLQIRMPTHPDYLLVTCKLLHACTRLRGVGVANTHFMKARMLDPTYKWLYYSRAVLHMQHGELDDAYQGFYNALECDPDYLDARYCRLVLLRRMQLAKHPCVDAVNFEKEAEDVRALAAAAGNSSYDVAKIAEIHLVQRTNKLPGRARLPKDVLRTPERVEEAVELLLEDYRKSASPSATLNLFGAMMGATAVDIAIGTWTSTSFANDPSDAALPASRATSSQQRFREAAIAPVLGEMGIAAAASVDDLGGGDRSGSSDDSGDDGATTSRRRKANATFNGALRCTSNDVHGVLTRVGNVLDAAVERRHQPPRWLLAAVAHAVPELGSAQSPKVGTHQEDLPGQVTDTDEDEEDVNEAAEKRRTLQRATSSFRMLRKAQRVPSQLLRLNAPLPAPVLGELKLLRLEVSLLDQTFAPMFDAPCSLQTRNYVLALTSEIMMAFRAYVELSKRLDEEATGAAIPVRTATPRQTQGELPRLQIPSVHGTPTQPSSASPSLVKHETGEAEDEVPPPPPRASPPSLKPTPKARRRQSAVGMTGEELGDGQLVPLQDDQATPPRTRDTPETLAKGGDAGDDDQPEAPLTRRRSSLRRNSLIMPSTAENLGLPPSAVQPPRRNSMAQLPRANVTPSGPQSIERTADDDDDDPVRAYIADMQLFAPLFGNYVAQYLNQGVTHKTATRSTFFNNAGVPQEGWRDDPAMATPFRSIRSYQRLQQLDLTADNCDLLAVIAASFIAEQTAAAVEESSPMPLDLAREFKLRRSVEVDFKKLTEAEKIALRGFFSENPDHASVLGRCHAWSFVTRLISSPTYVTTCAETLKKEREANENGMQYAEQRSLVSERLYSAIHVMFSEGEVRARRVARQAEAEVKRRNQLEIDHARREVNALHLKNYGNSSSSGPSGSGCGSCCLVA